MGRRRETLVQLIMAVKIAILSTTPFVAAAALPSQALPSCDERCGDLQIPYPFGTKEGCYLNKNFSITCNNNNNKPANAFLTNTNISVTNISISGELHILQPVVRNCNNNPSVINMTNFSAPAIFPVAAARNKFTTVGCNTLGFISGVLNGNEYLSGCVSMCANRSAIVSGSCSGSGCCELEIPNGLRNLSLFVGTILNNTSIVDFNPCGYAFVTRDDGFEFSSTYIQNFGYEEVEVVLGWGIRKETNYVCGPNSKRNSSFSEDGSEYRCQCLEGFEGNPYLPQGCQDIDECKEERLNDCKYECVNTIGNYTCNCPHDFKGDGRRGGEGCTPNSNSYVHIIIGVSVGFTVLLIGATWFYLGYRKWKFIKLKEKFFEKNGGLMLQNHLSQWQSSTTDMVRIFTQEELEKATNKFDESAVVGKGGYGTVYKGVLEDGLVVAIKKSKLVDHSQTSQFINEVMVLSQINHRNVVRLVGCCLETQVPLLVYEFIDNGTLYDHIHDRTKHDSLSWEARLKIALETAGVISYLHSSASTPIIHRDIKPTNILLDHNYTAKVSDFGASKLVPLDQTQLSTMVQGTLGYLDPEYLLTSELTEKSDVYSFGIVLLELITGKKAVSFEGPEVERNLAMYVLCAMKEDRVEEVVERGMTTERNLEQIKEVAKLAKECLRVRGEERPSMKEVAMALEGLRVVQVEHSLVNDKSSSNAEEMTYLLDGDIESNQYVVSSSINAVSDSIKAQILSQIHDGR